MRHLVLSLVVYRNLRELFEFVNSKLASEFDLVIISIVAYTNEELFKIESWQLTFNNVKVFYHEENLGYGKGHNWNARKVYELYGLDLFLVISNTDLIFSENVGFTLSSLKSHLIKNKDYAMVGPKIVGLDGRNQSPHRRLSFFEFMILGRLYFVPMSFRKSEIIEDSPEGRAYRLNGSFFMIRLRVFLDIGGFDENVFLYGEELILAERALRNGYFSYYDNKIKVIHNHSSTVSSFYSQERIMTMNHRNLVYYFKEYRGLNSLGCFLAEVFYYLAKIQRKIIFYLRYVLG